MKNIIKCICAVPFLSLLCSCSCEDVVKPDEPLRPLTFEQVSLEDDFWLPRLKTQKETLVPFSLEKTEPAVENLRLVGQYLKTGRQEKMQQLAQPMIKNQYGQYLLKVINEVEHFGVNID